ncbi:MAG: MarR family transcriptional regulator [Clostridia bacterium]|nr:MarR family transcriptional regulator [Clostridia bacterium]
MLSYKEMVDLFLMYRKKFKQFNETMNEFLVPYKISVQHAVYIMVLDTQGPMTMKEINAYIDNDGAITTRVIKRLKKEGYVQKIGKTIKKYKVELTHLGKLVSKELLTVFNKAKRTQFKELSSEDFVLMSKVSQKLSKKLSE